MKIRSEILLKPIFILVLLTLIINDHILKNLYPGLITGKLSDFAGLYIFPIFLFVILGSKKNTIYINKLIVIGTGIFFIFLQTPIFLMLLNIILNFVSLPSHNLTPDPTDLIALGILPFSYLSIKNFNNQSVSIRKRYHLNLIIIILCSFSFIATSFIGYSTFSPKIKLISKDLMDEYLFKFEKKMIENNFKIEKRTKLDNSLIYEVSFYYNVEITDPDNLLYDFNTRITSILHFSANCYQDSIILDKSEFYSFNYEITDSIAQNIFYTKIKPIL